MASRARVLSYSAWSLVFLCLLVPFARGQVAGTSGIKTVILKHVMRLDAIEVMKVLEAGTESSRGDPSEEDLRWFRHPALPSPPPGGRQFRVAYKFQAGDEWLKNLSLVVRNRTSKNIVFLLINLRFPEAGPATGTQGGISSEVRFGQIPSNAAYTASGERLALPPQKPLQLAPGQEATFPLADRAADIRAGIEQSLSFSSISMCAIHFLVYFEDGMQWNAGGYFIPDPSQPGKMTPSELQYFPGPLMGPPAP